MKVTLYRLRFLLLFSLAVALFPSGPLKAQLPAPEKAFTLKLEQPTRPNPDLKIGYKRGWSKEKVLAYEKPNRPDPSEYLKKRYIKKHLKQFKGGGSYFVVQSTLKKYGCEKVGRPDGQFVLPYAQAKILLKETGGDIAQIESALGIPPGSWDGQPLLLLVIEDTESLNLRMANGNENGANDLWIPGGYTPEGYSEAVLDQVPQSEYTAVIVNPCQ